MLACSLRVRRTIFAKSWTKWLATALSLVAFCLSLDAQAPQPVVSPGSDRVTFPRSITGVATGAPQTAGSTSATLVTSELTRAEPEATLDFSVAPKVRDFVELQERIG